jgi:hypothetical protein
MVRPALPLVLAPALSSVRQGKAVQMTDLWAGGIKVIAHSGFCRSVRDYKSSPYYGEQDRNCPGKRPKGTVGAQPVSDSEGTPVFPAFSHLLADCSQKKS